MSSELVPYFFSYKIRSFGLFRKDKTCIIAKFKGTDLVSCSYSREGKMLSYSQITRTL